MATTFALLLLIGNYQSGSVVVPGYADRAACEQAGAEAMKQKQIDIRGFACIIGPQPVTTPAPRT